MADQSLSDIEARAQSRERSIRSRGSTTAKLKATVDSAELYMQALQLADKPQDRKRLDAKFNELIKKAEHLKSGQDGARLRSTTAIPISMRKLTTRENIIILEGCKLNGFVFKPWERSPLPEEFVLKTGESRFTDTPSLLLSASQLKSFGGWQRPKEAFAKIKIPIGRDPLPNEATMSQREKVDLVQDLTSDCSVVASLCAGTSRVERGHVRICSSIVYPFDHTAQDVALSPNGKYIFRFYFNGCWRRVEIDDLLPTSTNSRLLHVIDRSHPGLLWPALTEKAYLKVRGGYDFPGSNSGTDLAVLSGWIPQQVFLHDDDVEPDCLWEELKEAFDQGNIFLTMGTGKLSRREQKQLGLAADHDYAVLDMKESGPVREMLIKNPWADGDVWTGTSRRKPNPNAEVYPEILPVDGSDEMLPGTFWMDFNSVFQHYENLYLNWNPARFNHREDRHFSWTLSQRRPASTIFDGHPQFAIRSSVNGDVWLLLNRHFRTGDYTQATNGRNGYISLYLYSKDGYRVLSSEDALQRGPFVDSPNTLLRFEAEANKSYTAVIVQQDLPAGKHNFTLSLFTNITATLSEATSRYATNTTLTAAWTRSTSGGNSDSVNYLLNPQFRITLNSDQRIAFVLRVADDTPPSDTPNQITPPSPEIHVKALLAASSGTRITRLRPHDTVAHSGSYRRSACAFEVPLRRGNYTLICSTFDEHQHAKFTLDFYAGTPQYPGVPGPRCETQASISALPSEGAGRLAVRTPMLTFTASVNRLLAPLTIHKRTKVTIVARQTRRNATSSLFRVAIEMGQGPYKKTIADSGFDDEEFHPIATGLRIEDVVLEPQLQPRSQRGNVEGSANVDGGVGLWLVVERLAQGSSAGVFESENVTGVAQNARGDDWIHPESEEARARKMTEVVKVEVLGEERIEVGAWGVGDG